MGYLKSLIKSKYLYFLILLIVIGFGLFFFFNRKMNVINSFKENQELITKQILKEEEKYKNDTFGGKTPLETYQMFLEALKKEDIELAVKYFPIDLQEKYLNLFKEIKKMGNGRI